MRILIVEDNMALSDTIAHYLSREGNTCKQVDTYHAALDELLSYPYDILLLDIMLPDASGLQVLGEMGHVHERPGVIIISAKNSLDDKLKGLNLGADDYLTKPFHLSELNARIKALHRRRNFNGNHQITFEEISIDTETHEVQICEKPINLTRKEYELLLYFLSNKNRVLTKQSIAEHLWGEQVDMYDSFDFVYQHIKNLRKKLTKAGSQDYINTLYGFGYKFNTKAT